MKWDIYLCGVSLGVKPSKLQILPVGFAASFFTLDAKSYNKKILKSNLLTLKKILIALAGPCVNLLFIVVFMNLKQDVTLIYINILILIFNMLCIYPLDGGRILKYILCIALGNRKALTITNIISKITAFWISVVILILGAKFKNISCIIIIIYIWIIIIKENRRYKIKRNIYKILENDIAIKED